jgi:hypothetical protein
MFEELHELMDSVVSDRVDNVVGRGHEPLSARPVKGLSAVHPLPSSSASVTCHGRPRRWRR